MPPTRATATTNGDGRLLNFQIAKAAENEPLSFQLGEEKFECLPAIPGIYLAEFIATSENDMGQRLNTALELIRGALQEHEEKRFDAFIRSKTVIVPMRTLAELAAGLFETYAARPTEPPPD